MLGPGRAFDTDKFLVVCANVIGSCYGTCGPTTINPMTGQPYGGDFPLVTVRDSVHLHSRLLSEHLGVKRVFAVIGGSMGGMQALEWTFIQEPVVASAVALACNGKHNAWQIGFSGASTEANHVGLVRSCASCHASNLSASLFRMPAPSDPGRPMLQKRTVRQQNLLACAAPLLLHDQAVLMWHKSEVPLFVAQLRSRYTANGRPRGRQTDCNDILPDASCLRYQIRTQVRVTASHSVLIVF
jgi:pimeloyl-ACP methyl ester carboxylesterase